jgi:glycosyltransferase involved in cell wall biosynthesis
MIDDDEILFVDKTQPLITVITVVFNGVQTLESTILSVINQSYKNIEYVIVDGGSTDGTIDIIKKYQQNISFWVSEPDNGIYDAMNKAVEKSSGDWIYFLGADDLMFNCIHEIVPNFESETLMYGDVIFKKIKKRLYGKFNSFKFIIHNLPHQALFYPRGVFDKYKYEDKYIYLADYYLNLLCWNDKCFKLKYMPIIIAEYNDLGMSSVKYDVNFINDRILNFVRYMPIYYSPYILLRLSVSIVKLKLLKKI